MILSRPAEMTACKHGIKSVCTFDRDQKELLMTAPWEASPAVYQSVFCARASAAARGRGSFYRTMPVTKEDGFLACLPVGAALTAV